jgi:hypothetical protein
MKPPRTLQLQPNQGQLQYHLELLNKALSRISFGTPASTSVPVGNAELDRNIQCWKATGTTPGTANTEFVIQHNLPYAPNFIIPHTKAAARIYQSTSHTTNTAATNKALGNVYLMCDTASVGYNIVIF